MVDDGLAFDVPTHTVHNTLVGISLLEATKLFKAVAVRWHMMLLTNLALV